MGEVEQYLSIACVLINLHGLNNVVPNLQLVVFYFSSVIFVIACRSSDFMFYICTSQAVW